MSPLAAKTIELARARIGIREIGTSNTGREVSAWLQRAGAEPGEPWCAAFLYCCVDDAARVLHLPNPYLRSAYCPDIGAWAAGHRILRDRPRPGCSFLKREGGAWHHTGIVCAAFGGFFHSIEGNTNSSGAREGVAVLPQTRKLTDRYAFVWWDELCPAARRTLLLGGRPVFAMPVCNGLSLVPLRAWCAWLGWRLTAAPGEEPPFAVNGRQLAYPISLVDGAAHVPLREMAALDPALRVTFDAAANTVGVTRHTN